MKEEEIRPQRVFDEYLRLAERDAETYFGEVDKTSLLCPACETVGEPAFMKYGFTYETCPNCHTLYVNPRPDAEAFSKYYTQSPSSEFWATTFYKETAQARREKLWKPKARQIRSTMARYGAESHTLIDVGGGSGLFAEEIRDLCGVAPIVIEPSPQLAEICREKLLSVVQKFLEYVQPDDLPSGPKTFVSFELFEHLHDPVSFLLRLKDLMGSGDLFIFTTLSGTGVDIQALWEDSKSVTPPHHLNFLNPQSVALLISRLGFENLAITTPGKLDIDILVNSRAVIKDRFWKTFVETASEEDKVAWQGMIAATGHSSHMMVVCRKP